MPKKRKRRVKFDLVNSSENESSNSSLQNLRNAVESNIQVKVEDEDDEKQGEGEDCEPGVGVPDEATDSDMEDFEGFVGVDGEILDVKLEEMPELEPEHPVGDAEGGEEPDEISNDNAEADEMIIEDYSEDELEPVEEPKKPPPKIPKVLVKNSIPCATKSCMHRKENKRTGKSSNKSAFQSLCCIFESLATLFPQNKNG